MRRVDRPTGLAKGRGKVATAFYSNRQGASLMDAVLFTHDIQYEIGILFHEKLRRAGVSTSLFVAPGQYAHFSGPLTSNQGRNEDKLQRCLAEQLT